MAIPNTLTALSAVAASDVQIDLSWLNDNLDADQVIVERQQPDLSWIPIIILAGDATSYSNTGLVPSTTYSYRVYATDGEDESAKSDTATASTQPVPAPSALSATEAGDSQIDLAWTNNATDADLIFIERSQDQATWSVIATRNPADTAYSSIGLMPASTYYYRLRTTKSGAESAYTAIASATTTALAPAVPVNLNATPSATAPTIYLSWDNPSTDADSIDIEVSTGGVNFSLLANVPATQTSYAHSGLPLGTTRYYRIRSKRSSDSTASVYTATVSAQTPVTADAQPVPTGFAGVAVGQDGILLSWEDVGNENTGYTIQRKSGSDWLDLASLAPGITTYTDSGLTASTAYQYQIKTNGATDSAYTEPITVTTNGASSLAPTNLVAVANGTEIVLTWQDNVQIETAQELYCATSASGPWTLIQTLQPNVTTFTHTGLTPGQTYYYRIRARIYDEATQYSNVASANIDTNPSTSSLEQGDEIDLLFFVNPSDPTDNVCIQVRDCCKIVSPEIDESRLVDYDIPYLLGTEVLEMDTAGEVVALAEAPTGAKYAVCFPVGESASDTEGTPIAVMRRDATDPLVADSTLNGEVVSINSPFRIESNEFSNFKIAAIASASSDSFRVIINYYL